MMENKTPICQLIFNYINDKELYDTITRKDLYRHVIQSQNGHFYGKATVDTIRRVFTWNGILTDTDKPGVYIKTNNIRNNITYNDLLNAYKSHIPIKPYGSLLDPDLL